MALQLLLVLSPLSTAWAYNTSAFVYPINGTQCLGLTQHQTPTAQACADACCSAGDAYATWVYDVTASCWLGDIMCEGPQNTDFIGASKVCEPSAYVQF